MTSLEHLATTLHLFLALALLGVLWFRWRTFRIDATRQEFFALRDELFDCALNGELAFNHFSYTFLRLRINGLIRFAHRISFSRLVLSLFFFKSSGIPESIGKQHKEWEDSLRALPQETRTKLRRFYAQMAVIQVQHMVLNSPITCVLFGSLVLIAAMSAAVMHCWELLAKRLPGLDLLEAQALEA